MKKNLLLLFVGFSVVLGLQSVISSKKLTIEQKIAKKSLYQETVSSEALVSTKKFFLEQLSKQEAALAQALSNEFGINSALLQADYSHQWRQSPSIPSSQEPITILAYDVAKEFNFNADKLHIIFNRTDNGSPASSSDTELIIEMNLFPEFALPAQKFIIAHELQHILQSDCAQLRSIKKRINAHHMTPAQTRLLETYNKFQEKRADFKAALQGIEWAQGYLAFAQEGLKRCKSGAGNLHPTWQERVNWAQDIVQHMQNVKIA